MVNASPTLNSRMLEALLALFALRGIAKGAAIGGILVTCLAVYTLVADALAELTTSIATLWATSDSITRLLLLVLAVYFVKKVFPYILLLHRKGVI